MKITKLVCATLVAATLSTATVFADEESAPWLKVSGDVNVDATGKKSADYEANLRADASLRFEVLVREGIKLVVKARIEQQLRQSGQSQDWQEQELEKVLEEAYIQIDTDKVSGLPRATITLGKHQMAFGQALTELPMFRDALLYNLNAEREMVGMTVTLPTNFLKIVDTVAVSLYEAGAGDFKISDDHGASIKMSKRLSDKVTAQVSGMMKEHAGQSDNETRGSIGFVFDGGEGSFKVWAEGIVMNHNPSMTDDTVYASQLGASKKLGRGTIVVQYEVLQKTASELTVAYNIPVGSRLTISPEVRMTTPEGGDTETQIGVRARVQFQKDSKARLAPRRG